MLPSIALQGNRRVYREFVDASREKAIEMASHSAAQAGRRGAHVLGAIPAAGMLHA